MTRAHVRLLGPCFKTGRVEDRPIRHRPAATLCVPDRKRPARSGRAASSASPVERRPRAEGTLSRGTVLGLGTSRPGRAVNSSRRPKAGQVTFSAGFWPPQNRSRRSTRGKCARRRQPDSRASAYASRCPASPPHQARQAEFPGPTLRIHPFTSRRFHVLLNSLFKVLFNFPSRYLSAIGLVSVFSLRWSLPPALGCILKQPDSKDARSHVVECR